MPTQKTRAAVAYAGKADFRIEDLNIEQPRADEVLVEIEGVGLCHTDLTFSSGDIPYPFPSCLLYTSPSPRDRG